MGYSGMGSPLKDKTNNKIKYHVKLLKGRVHRMTAGFRSYLHRKYKDWIEKIKTKHKPVPEPQ